MFKGRVVFLLCLSILIILMILLYIQKNVVKNQKTINNLEHFIGNEIPSYFTDKTISKGCCPSTYSTDRGCVCLDDKDKNEIYTRGSSL